MVHFQGILHIFVIFGAVRWVGVVVGSPIDHPWRVSALVAVILYSVVVVTCVLFLPRSPSVRRNGTHVPPSS